MDDELREVKRSVLSLSEQLNRVVFNANRAAEVIAAAAEKIKDNATLIDQLFVRVQALEDIRRN